MFRAPKRRKVVKGAKGDAENLAKAAASPQEPASDQGHSDDGIETTAPRARRPNKHPKTGVTFTSTFRSRLANADDELALIPASEPPSKLRDMSERFTGTTGQVVNVDKHMYVAIISPISLTSKQTPSNASRLAYIDSAMAKRQVPSTASPQPEPQPRDPTRPHSPSPITTTKPTHISTSTLSNPLSEVPLPTTTPKPPPPPKRPPKPRLDRHGRPRAFRPRPRRTSTDLARDALVDAVLSENRLLDHHLHSSSTTEASGTTATDSHGQQHASSQTQGSGKGGAAQGEGGRDDDFAAKFEREFEEGLAERRAVQQMQQRKKDEDKKGKDKDKDGGGSGPRLGGSRAARAKMAEREREKEKERKGRGP